MKKEQVVLKLKELIKERKLSEVSKTSGIPYVTLHKIASGTTKNPGSQVIEKISDYFEGVK